MEKPPCSRCGWESVDSTSADFEKFDMSLFCQSCDAWMCQQARKTVGEGMVGSGRLLLPDMACCAIVSDLVSLQEFKNVLLFVLSHRRICRLCSFVMWRRPRQIYGESSARRKLRSCAKRLWQRRRSRAQIMPSGGSSAPCGLAIVGGWVAEEVCTWGRAWLFVPVCMGDRVRWVPDLH
jgi:hypothetical protein